MRVKLAVVAALEREIAPLVKGWRREEVMVAGRKSQVFVSEKAVVIAAGTGAKRASEAARALVEKYSPEVLLSVGFAGACQGGMKAGELVIPAVVLDEATGSEYRSAFGQGTVVTSNRVAGVSEKRAAREQYAALAVEMEAAGIARVAEESGRSFVALKVISDGANEEMGFLAPFVRPEGFATGRFVAHIALRPWLWPAVKALGQNSAKASESLRRTLGECLAGYEKFAAVHSKASAAV